jgi:hypothetical protein
MGTLGVEASEVTMVRLPRPTRRSSKRLLHGVVFDAVELQLVHTLVQHAAADAQTLRGQFIEGAFRDPPAHQPHHQRNDERKIGQTAGEQAGMVAAKAMPTASRMQRK